MRPRVGTLPIPRYERHKLGTRRHRDDTFDWLNGESEALQMSII